jgi:hypothetical protein
MNLLGMKRKLLPYGMALGGGGALGTMGAASNSVSSAAPSSASGGKSAPVGQNTYSAPFTGPAGASGPTTAGGKSSGLGQGGYGAAPAFQQPQQPYIMGQQVNGIANNDADAAIRSAQNQPSFAQSPYGMGPSSVNTTTQQDMMGGNRGGGQSLGQVMQGLPMMGGKSSGAGQGGYQSAPGYGQQATQQASGSPVENAIAAANQQMGQQQQVQQQQGYPAQQLGQLGSLLRGQPLGGLASQRQAQGGFGPQAPTQEGYNGFKAMTGSPMSFDEYSQSRSSKLTQQPQQQTQQASPYGGGYNPQVMSGLQSLFNQMMGQYGGMGAQQPQTQQPMPQYRSPGLDYRPDYIRAQENLNRVRPSVQKQNQDAQAARIAELEAQLAGFQSPTTNSFDGGGG